MSRRFPAMVTGVAAVAVLGLGLSACGSSGSGSGNASSSGSGGKPGAGKNLELVVGTKSDDFYVTMECGAEAEAKALGAKLTVNGPADFSVSEQAPILNSVAASKPDALMVAPTDAKALNPELTRIQNAGTKIIFVDTTSSDASLGVSRISTDNVGGGKVAADNLGQQIGGKGTVAVINVNPGISTTDARIQGFANEMKAKYPNVKVLATQYDNDSAATGVQHAGKTGKVKVATFDAEPQQITFLKNNTIQLAVAQDPYLEGQDAV